MGRNGVRKMIELKLRMIDPQLHNRMENCRLAKHNLKYVCRRMVVDISTHALTSGMLVKVKSIQERFSSTQRDVD
jgi:hypothetical protein